MASTQITEQKKEEIRDTADIVDVISDYVKLKKSGSQFTGLCPFHNEKTPSFYVTPRLGIYKCFGCGEGGDVFNFIMKTEGVGFVEAMRTLAERYNIELPQQQDESFDERTQLTEGIYHALRFAGVYYFQQLTGEDDAAEARNYLQKRGLNAQTIKKWGLGFAGDAFDSFYKHAIESGINETYLSEAGLIKYSERNQKPYDTFRGRLMFPIFTPSSKVIGFGGRILGDRKGPKYLNSPQTKVYNKSEVIYGIHMARNEIRKADQAILVEGYMDVLSLWQHGIKNVIATSGTSVTQEQMRRIRNYSKNLLMVYDADSAGQSAMLRGLDVALQEDLFVRLMHLPDGEDPDSFVQQFGAESFHEYSAKEAKDFVSFQVDQAERMNEWEDPLRRRELVTGMLSSMAKIGDEGMLDTMVRHLRKLSGIGEQALRGELSKLRNEVIEQNRRARDREMRQRNIPDESEQPQSFSVPSEENIRRNKQTAVRKPSYKRPGAEKELIRLMIREGEEMIYFVGYYISAKHFEDEELRMFFEDITRRYEKEKDISIEIYTAKDPPFPELVSEVFMQQHTVSERKNIKGTEGPMRHSDPYAAARGAMKVLYMNFLENQRETINHELSTADETRRAQLYEQLTENRQMRLKAERVSSEVLFPLPEELDEDAAS